MPLSAADRTAIHDLIHLHGHLVDAGELDRAAALFTPDAAYDVTDLGGGVLRAADLPEAALALGDANPVGHHVTNVVITETGQDSARVRAKGLGVRADGTVGSVVYSDAVTRRPEGWRIAHRTVTARRAPLGRRETDAAGVGPREILERHRRAAIRRSVDDMGALYAEDAVHEFPFAAPGVPSRLEGREEIMDWIAAGWRSHGLAFEGYRTVAVHDTTDPGTIVVEQEALGTSAATGEFALLHLMVLTVRHGRITRLRDYVNIPAAMAAIGSDLT